MAKEHEDAMLCVTCGEESEALNDDDECPDCETWLVIQYRCPVDDGGCGHEWSEEWSCACDSECPECGLKNITALSWEDAT